MIISAAILAKNISEFSEVWHKYVDAGFTHIDIDIQAKPFVQFETVTVLEVVDFLLENPQNLAHASLTWDLKLNQEALVAAQKEISRVKVKSQRVYVYAKPNEDLLEWGKDIEVGIGVLDDAKIPNLEFFQQVEAVQFMTIADEKQGGAFDEILFERAVDLRFQGYEGEIGLDGGINLQSARMIASVNKEFPIDRVSVGSYFQNASAAEIGIRMQKLQLALHF